MNDNANGTPRQGPLHGLKVLDLTQFLSGPFSTMILADMGADVVKIEPHAGELSRIVPPHFVDTDSIYYLSINRNKRSITLDFKNPDDMAELHELALAADVVIENFRPGVMERLGFSYDDLSKKRPDLVWCSISGFGQVGPWRDWPAYDMVVQALSGGMSITGSSEPVRAGIPLADICGGMFGIIGVLSVLYERQRTGRGRWVDVAMLDGQLAMLSYQAGYYLHTGQVPGMQGSGHDYVATYRSFVAGDGVRVVVTANTEKMWAKLVKVLGREDLAQDPRFTDNQARFDNRAALYPELEAAFLAKPAAEWMPLLIAAGVPAGVINTLDRALDNEHVTARHMVQELTPEDGRPDPKPIRVAGNPIKFMGEPEREHNSYPSALNADHAEVLKDWLGR